MDAVTSSFEDIARYVVDFLDPSAERKGLAFFTANRQQGFVLQNNGGEVDLTFPIEAGGPMTETAVRAFFVTLGVAPWRDYPADGGATRILAYPLRADASAIGDLITRVLVEVCGAAPGGSILIQYWDHPPSPASVTFSQ